MKETHFSYLLHQHWEENVINKNTMHVHLTFQIYYWNQWIWQETTAQLLFPSSLKGIHNGRTMLSYIQEHIFFCSWKQFESAWKSIWVLRYCKKYDVLFSFFDPSLGVPVSISETRPWPVKHCDEIVITGSGPSLRATVPCHFIT